MKMEKSILVVGKMERKMDMASFIKIHKNMQEISKMISIMD